MESLPNVTGMIILSEVGRDAYTRRFRLDSPRNEFLVMFDEPTLSGAVNEAAKRFGSVEIDGFCRVERVIVEGGQLGVVVEGEIGECAWRLPAIGELESLPILHSAAQVIAALHAEGLTHGSLKPDGITVLPEGDVMILPPVMLPDFLYEVAGATGGAPHEVDEEYMALSAGGRDLSALANLACHLIAGVQPSSAAGVGVLPVEVMNMASPATAQAVRLLLEAAPRRPSPSECAEILGRIGWARLAPSSRPARPRPAVSVTARPPSSRRPSAPGSGRTGATFPAAVRGGGQAPADTTAHSPREAPARRGKPRIPASVGVFVLLLIGGALLLTGGIDALQEFWSGRPRTPTESLELADPMVRRDSQDASIMPAPGTEPESPIAASDATDEGEASASLADQILKELAEKKAKKNRPKKKKRSYDRSLIDAGDRLKDAGRDILADIRDGKVAHAEKNAHLERAIQKLKDARDKYDSFSEQFPSRTRLVDGSVEDVNSMIFFAYRQKTSK